MEGIRELVVPLDGLVDSVRALSVAGEFARRLDLAVSAVIVSSPRMDTMADIEWLDDVTERAAVELARSVVVPEDDTVEAIIDFAAESDRSVLCMASHGRGGVGQAVLGSVSAAVVRESPSPVMLVGPHCSSVERFDGIDICLDGSDRALDAIGPGLVWSKQLGSTPYLLNVEDPGAPAVHGDTAVGAEVARPGQDLLARGISVDWEVLHGLDPAVAIAEHAARTGAALVVATTHGRSGLRSAAFGSVAMGIVRNAPCPVLLLGPNVAVARAAA